MMMLKRLIFFFLITVSWIPAHAQVITNQVAAGLASLKTLGNPPECCLEKIEEVNFLKKQDPRDFHKSVRLPVRSKPTVKYDGLDISVMTKAEAEELFRFFQELEYMPKKYLEDGCYARAHEMALIAEKNGIQMGKAFLSPKNENGPLLYPDSLKNVKPSPFSSYFGGWKYHAVPFVMVRNGNKIEPMVFDLGVASNVQTFSEWNRNLSSKPKGNRITVRSKGHVFQDGGFRSDGESIIHRLIETEQLIDEIGMSEYVFRVEQGWL